MDSIKQVLMRRDGISSEEAVALIDEARKDLDHLLANGDIDSAYDICQTHFGLEPDYLDKLMF